MARVVYRAQLDRLSEIGLARELGETREQFAERIRERIPSFEELTELHVAARLADPNRDTAFRSESDERSWKRLSRAVGNEIGRSTKLWRRLLGWLHPVSFFDSK